MATIKQRVQNIRNLPKYQGLSEEQLKDVIRAKIKEERGIKEPKTSLDDFGQFVEGLFTKPEETKAAQELAKKYLEEYNLETSSEKNLLRHLVYLEVFHNLSLQKSVNEYQETNGSIPIQLLDAMHRNLEQIVDLKEKLGLNKPKKTENESMLTTLDKLKKKFKVWKELNQGSRTLNCPHCSKMIMLRIRTEAWEAQKHPYFKDRILANDHLIALYQSGKLTREDVALVLGVSPDYVTWLIDKAYSKKKAMVEGSKEDLVVQVMSSDEVPKTNLA